jgi:hypothetical protein
MLLAFALSRIVIVGGLLILLSGIVVRMAMRRMPRFHGE